MKRHFAKRTLTLACSSLLAATGLVSYGVATTGAATELLACVATGPVNVTANPTAGWDWSISGSGSCLNPSLQPTGTQTVVFSGTGHSDSLGLCDGVLVNNLALTVSMTLTNTVTGGTRSHSETWGLQITTYPVATPFLVSGPATGVGTIVSHIFLQCPPNGSASGAFAWVQSPA
jgi:hypothetical protein